MKRAVIAAGVGAMAILTAGLSPVASAKSGRVVNIQLTDRGFTPSNVVAALDQPIEIHVINSGHHHHQFSIPYYRIYSRDLPPGGVTDIGFSPWSAGEFDMTSDPTGSERPEFTGHFIVLNPK